MRLPAGIPLLETEAPGRPSPKGCAFRDLTPESGRSRARADRFGAAIDQHAPKLDPGALATLHRSPAAPGLRERAA